MPALRRKREVDGVDVAGDVAVDVSIWIEEM